MAKSDSDWDQRVLCSDGNCIGIIGADGCCKECGLPYAGDLPSTADKTDMDDGGVADSTADQQLTENAPPVNDDQEDGSDEPDDFWENRTLCADGSCIGVIGPDGHCKECGKPC